MSAPVRLLDTGLKPARWNIAMTAALGDMHRAGRIPDTLRFHRYPRSVLLGRNQVMAKEVHVDRCRRGGIEIARRVTGGGAIYLSPRILVWDFAFDRRALGLRLPDAADAIMTAVAGGLSRLGLPARCSAPFTITVDGRKVCGSSGSFDGPSGLMQGTILVDFDRNEMASVLKVYLGQMSCAANLGTIAEILGRIPADEEIIAALTASLSEAFRRPMVTARMDDEEWRLADRLLMDEIGTDAFVLGHAPAQARQPSSPARRRA